MSGNTDLALRDGNDAARAARERKRKIKTAWQRRTRATFALEHGFSQTTYYRFNGQREAALQRDGYRCVRCGMTDADHRTRWGRPITVDHIDRDETHNALGNFQTLCLTCHGRKDLLPRLRTAHVPEYQQQILEAHQQGATYQAIADRFGFSIGAIWKWVQRWKGETSGC